MKGFAAAISKNTFVDEVTIVKHINTSKNIKEGSLYI